MASIFFFNSLPQSVLEHFFCLSELKEMETIEDEERKDWAAGRLAVKIEIRRYHRKSTGLDIDFNQIEIISRKHQKPTYLLHGDRISETAHEEGEIADISLAHSCGVGAGLLSQDAGKTLVGVDIEKIRKFGNDLGADFLTRKEKKILQIFSKEKCNEIGTVLWCLKEAYLKALGVGLFKNPADLEVTLINNGQWAIIKDNEKETNASARWSKISGGFVLAEVKLQSNEKSF